MMPKQSAHFSELDGLRGIAALLVLFAHACSVFTPTNDPFLWHKHLAVYFFFMLSGFVIACAYERKLRAGFGIVKFALLRVIRLYPLVIVGALLSSFSLLTFDPAFASDPSLGRMVAMAVACLPSPGVQFGFSPFQVNPPEWSLFFELIAYAIFALFVPKLSTRSMLVIVVLCFVGWAWSVLTFRAGHIPLWTKSFGAIGSFMLGVILWRTKELLRGQVRPAPFAVLALLLFAICSVPASLPEIFDPLIVAMILPGVILSGAARTTDCTPAMKLLGDLSYPVYILHWGILQFFFHAVLPTLGFASTVASSMGVAVCVSFVLLRFFDEPVRKVLAGIVRRTEQRETVTAVSDLVV